MSRTRIVKGNITKIIGGDYKRYSKENIENIGSKVIQVGKEEGVSHGEPEKYIPPPLNIVESEYKLESTYAHDQLKELARQVAELPFILMMLNIFGQEIEISALSKLYRGLSDSSIKAPEIIVTKTPVGAGKAAYSNKRKKILVWDYFLNKATEDNDGSAELMAALVEEYGHHIDNLLRTELAENGIADADLIDEGAKFAYSLFYFDVFNESSLSYANAKTPDFEGELKVDFSEIHTPIKEYVNQDRWKQTRTPQDADVENFGFGFGDGTHGGIEFKALADIIFSQSETFKIYYGNWLRDVSQVLVKKVVRLTAEAQRKLKSIPDPRIQDLLQNMPNKISHEGWVELIELFAAYEFVYKQNREEENFHYEDHLAVFRESYGKLTKDILGIYRPEEHIDNPKGLEDDSMIDISFQYESSLGVYEPKTLYAGEYAASLEINKYNQKNYIWTEQEDPLRPSSDLYMSQQLKLAVVKGKTTGGFRHLGAAFHVLEDYFAHSNFTELSLMKAGYTQVYPWVQGKQGKNYTDIPIVTGKFLEDDTAASVLPKIADLMFPIGLTDYHLRKPEEITFNDAFILTTLSDLSKGQTEDGAQNNPTYVGLDAAEWLNLYEKYLYFIDMKAEFLNSPMGWPFRIYDRAMHTLGDMLSTYNNVVFNLLLSTVDDDIKEEQTHHSNKDYGSDPTHTQLAKDDHHHPLNPLASQLAEMAVKDIGQRIKDIWDGKTIDPDGSQLTKYVLTKYSRHPQHTHWMDETIREWGRNNKSAIKWLESPTPLAHAHKVSKRIISREKVQEIINYFK